MADKLHEQLIRGPAEKFNQWREKHRDNPVDLSGCDLRGHDFLGYNLERVRFANAVLTDASFPKGQLAGADFSGADVSGATFVEANLVGVVFVGSKCVGAKFSNVNSDRKTDFTAANLHKAEFIGTLNHVVFTRADLREANFRNVSIQSVDMPEADLRSAQLRRCTINNSNLRNAKINLTDFFEANLNGSDFSGVQGAEEALNLESTDANRVRYFEHCERRTFDEYCDWEKLRTFGRMPLFGLSYTVLIFIPLYIYLIAWHNAQVDELRVWADKVEAQAAANAEEKGHRLAEVAKHHLCPLPLPSLSLLLLASTILLAAASTIYTIACPSRVKEFTRDVWCDQLGRSLVHYWPFAWNQTKKTQPISIGSNSF